MTSSRQGKPDYLFITISMVIIFFGLIMLSSASMPVSYRQFHYSYYYLIHQILFGFLPGLFLFFLFSKIDYHRLKKYAFPLLIISLVFLILVFIPGLGVSYDRARSWVNFFGFSFQPSEIVKLSFLIYLSAWLTGREEKRKNNLQNKFLPFLGILSLIVFLMALQPDVGTMSVILLTSLAVYFISGEPLYHFFWLGGAGFSLFALLIKIAPYRAARLMTFLHPELDPQGIGYHINQAFLAIGSGGLFGLGLGHSRQKFEYLPEAMGDSVFAVIIEELGFFLTLGLIILFLFFMFRGFKISLSAPDKFGRLLSGGIIFWLTSQAFLNMGAMTGLFPLTGIPLPFISQGGTALAVSLGALGLVVNISKQGLLKN